jgi:hypothetical protein
MTAPTTDEIKHVAAALEAMNYHVNSEVERLALLHLTAHRAIMELSAPAAPAPAAPPAEPAPATVPPSAANPALVQG